MLKRNSYSLVATKKGKGIKINLAKAVELYTKAAQQGVPEAQYNLVAYYENGYGVEKN